MYVKMTGLYGGMNYDAWFRKLGDCFDFVNKREFATDLTAEECGKVLDHADWYCKQYNAQKMMIEASERETEVMK